MSFLSLLRKAVGMNEQKHVAVVCELIGLVLRLAARIFCVSGAIDRPTDSERGAILANQTLLLIVVTQGLDAE
ncbi:hypothetical protein [Serratia fonticola]|uniref:hypothetical protein n=1 Tax=Serratia fonticola TaxID=47917 RepID=UPI003AAF38D7